MEIHGIQSKKRRTFDLLLEVGGDDTFPPLFDTVLVLVESVAESCGFTGSRACNECSTVNQED